MELNSKNIKKILLIIFLGALFFTGLQNFSTVTSIITRIFNVFSPLVAALCIAFVLNILLTALETKVFKFWDKAKRKFILKLKRPVCLTLTYLIAFGLLSLVILVIIPDIIETITYLASKMPSIAIKTRDWAESVLSRFNIDKAIPESKINWNALASTITGWLSGSSGKIVDSAVNITSSVFSGMFDAVFSLVISVYILAQKERIGRFVKRVSNAFFSAKINHVIFHISTKAYDLFSRFISGQLVEAFILGMLCFIGMSIFRFPNALIISVLISVTALVPIVGAAIGTIFGFLLIVITDPLKALLFVVFFVVLQQLEGNLIYPKVVGKAVGLPGVLVVSAVMIGGNIGGVFGTLISVPTVAVLFTLLKELLEFSNSNKQPVAIAADTDDEELPAEETTDLQPE